MEIRFEEVPVPVERLNGAVEQSMQKVRTEYREKMKSHLIKRAAVAAILILTAGILAANPVLAAKLPLIGHIFEMVQEGQRYSGNFDKMAQIITENTPNVSGGVTISLSEIYSNREAMYAAAVIKTEKPFPEEVKESNMLGDDDIGYRMYLSVAEQEFDFMKTPAKYEVWEWPGEEYRWNSIDMRGKYVDEYTFIGQFRIDYNLYPICDFEIPDTFHWKLKIDAIDNLHSYSAEGNWEFDTNVTVDTGEAAEIAVNESAPNGEVISSVTMTPYEARINYEVDESKVQPGYEKRDSLQSVIVDADGKEIIDKAGMFPVSGYNLSEITVYYFAVQSDEEYGKIQDEVNRAGAGEELVNYLENISVQKIRIDLTHKTG